MEVPRFDYAKNIIPRILHFDWQEIMPDLSNIIKLCKSQANPENPARNENPFGDPLAVVFIPCDSLRDCHSLLAASRVETDPAP